MQQTKELTVFQEPITSPRKHQLANVLSQEQERETPLEDLQAVKQYIHLNVKSQRKNLLSLYSLIVQDPQDFQSKFPLSTSPPSSRIVSNRHKMLDPLDRLKTHKSNFLQSSNNKQRENMIISNKFSQKQKNHKSPLTKIILKQKQQKSNLNSSSGESSAKNSPAKVITQKHKYPLPELPQIRLKTTKMKKSKPQSFFNELNPWEYLVIPDQPYPYQI